MRKVLIIAAVVALLAACDSKPDAPFGLTWGQSMSKTQSQYGEKIKCDDASDLYAQCSFYGGNPFNEWIDYGVIGFSDNKLSHVTIWFRGENPDPLKSFLVHDVLLDKLNSEFSFLEKHGADKNTLDIIRKKCTEFETCDDINESVTTDLGRVDIELKTTSTTVIPTARITYELIEE
ncbi:hypothetical protein GKR55_17425 [Providencia stuartii]|nr:hypothetical protein [Providencia stuartii]EMD1716110.1 hypothetical protein [Providencia stuartii]MTB82262.1 hypothetical protein [Providencia stuartii]